MKKVILTEKAPKPIGPYSQAIKAGPLLFGAGQIAIDPETGKLVGKDIREQTRRVLENIKNILEAAGYSLEDVAATFVYLKDLEDFPAFNEEYAKFFKEKPPARTTVEVSNLPKGALIEISFIAYKES